MAVLVTAMTAESLATTADKVVAFVIAEVRYHNMFASGEASVIYHHCPSGKIFEKTKESGQSIYIYNEDLIKVAGRV